MQLINKSLRFIEQKFNQFSNEFLKGDVHHKKNYLINVLFKVIPALYTREELKLKGVLTEYLVNLNSLKSSDTFVFMLSGTHYIKDFEGNRPIRLTKEFLKLNIPVLFSYWRWSTKERLPKFQKNGLLFQSPIDLTIKYIKIIKEHDFNKKNKILLVSFPHNSFIDIANDFKSKGWTVIYDVRDNWEEFEKVGQAIWYKKSSEEWFVKHSDIVCAVSKPLLEKMISISNDKIIHLIPNAVDSSLVNYQNFKLSPRQGPIVIGYIGHLTEAWFDWESVIKIADKNKNWEFQIIGHSLPDKILLPSNIKYIGRKKPQEFKDLTKKWRAAIIPFKISKLADCVDPIKVYEYLALGLPVVSFRMPQIDNYPFVYTANNVEEFEKKLNEAIYTNLNKPIILEFLINNTWEKRALQFLHLIEHKNNI